MTRILRAALAVLVIGAAASAWPAPAGADSIGISPAILRFENALRGGTVENSVAVFTDSDQPATITFEKSGAVAPWITFFDVASPAKPTIDRLTAPPDGADARVGVRLQVPASTPNGVYVGAVTILAAVAPPNATASVARVGAQVDVAVTVTGTQILSGTIVNASVAAAEVEVGQPVRFDTVIQNTGNVTLAPNVGVTVRSGGQPVGTVTAEPASIAPSAVGRATAVWDTTGARVGDYAAQMTATSGAAVIGDRSVNFRLVPEGSLRRRGELTALEVGEATAGGGARVTATFQNTGEMEASASFRGELRRDGKLLREVASAPRLVAPGERAKLTFVVPVPEDGSYRIRGSVNFSGKETDSRDITFDVGGGTPWLMLPAVALVGVAVAAAGRRRRGRQRRVARDEVEVA